MLVKRGTPKYYSVSNFQISKWKSTAKQKTLHQLYGTKEKWGKIIRNMEIHEKKQKMKYSGLLINKS